MQDILNNSPYGSQYMLGDDRYNPTQSNVLGQPLSPTPTAAGLPAVDPVHDTRTPQDIKRDAPQANLDTLAAHDTKDKIVNPSTGYIFDTAPTDRKNQLITGLIAYGTSFLSGENEGVALQRAGQAVNSQIAMSKRQALIPGLIQKGYADVDIQKYLETGDTRDLLVNKGKVNIVGDRSVNELTGETKDLGMTPQQQADQQLSQAKIAEDVRHNRASEGFEGARLGIEQQRFNMAKQQLAASSPAQAQSVITTNAKGEQVVAPAGMYNDHLAILTNSRGTPLIDAKAGTVQVKDINTNRTYTVVQDTTAANAAAQTATTGQGIIDAFEKGGLGDYTGGWGLERGARNVWSGNELTPTLKSQIDNINGTVEAAIEARLAVENKGKQVTKPQIEAQKNAIGYLSVDNTPEQNDAILARQKKFLAQTVSRADELTGRNQSEYTTGVANYQTENNPPTSAYGATAPQPPAGKKDFSGMW
ncbi:hypothetical protein ABL632_003996 [Salmonella enterica subsp. enterica serovar Braenderup]